MVSVTSAQISMNEDFTCPRPGLIIRPFCPTNFKYVRSVNGCYSVVLDNLEWTIAGLRCKALHPNAHLVIINHAAEQQAIANMMSSYYSDSLLAGCARYPAGHGCREMFWTAGQRVDLSRESPFVWKQTPGTGSCCDGPCMSEMRYSNWAGGEPNNSGEYDSNLQRAPSRVSEKCLQLCRGAGYIWNDALCEIPTCSICEIDLPSRRKLY